MNETSNSNKLYRGKIYCFNKIFFLAIQSPTTSTTKPTFSNLKKDKYYWNKSGYTTPGTPSSSQNAYKYDF